MREFTPLQTAAHGPPVLLAPMAGATDPPFRQAAMRLGCGYTVSEIVASEALASARQDMVRRASGAGLMAPLVVQLAGGNPSWMAVGAKVACDAGADVIDINMGCPAKTVTGAAAGSALMRDPDHALRLIEAVVAASIVPVTLKMRLGWRVASQNAAAIAQRAEGAGVAMIVVHGRTRDQFFTGAADWAAIRPVAQAVSIPVIANGDITCADSARAAMAASGAYGVMVGRASLGKPWFAGALQAALNSGGRVQAPSPEGQCAALLALYDAILGFYGTRLGVRMARKHLAAAVDAAWWVGEVARRTERAVLCQTEEPAKVAAHLRRLFDPALEAAA